MPLLVDIVQVLSPATNQSQVINFPALGSATPKALMAFASGATSTGQSVQDSRNSIGLATSVANQYVMSYFSRNGDTTSQSRQARRNTRFVECVTNVSASLWGSLDAVNPGSITIDFGNTAIQSLVTYVALSGDTITNATVAEWPHQRGTPPIVDPNTPTLAGFQPDCGIFITNSNTAWNNAPGAEIALGLVGNNPGVDTDQIVLGTLSAHNATTTVDRHFTSLNVLELRSGGGVLLGRARVDSWAPAGFNATWLDESNSTGKITLCLLLQGPEVALAIEDSPVSPGTVPSSLSFAPLFGLHASNSSLTTSESGNANSRFSIGAFNGSFNASHGFAGLTGVGTPSQAVFTEGAAGADTLSHWDGVSIPETANGQFSGNNINSVFDAADGTVRKFAVFGLGDPGGPPPSVRPAGLGVFSGDGSGSVQVKAQPAGRGVFSADASGDVVASPPVRQPAGLGVFSAEGEGDIAKVSLVQPAGLGIFSAEGAGNVIGLGVRLPAGQGVFSADASGDIIASTVARPAGLGVFSADAAGTVFTELRPAGLGVFSADASGAVTVPLKAAAARRVCKINKQNRLCEA